MLKRGLLLAALLVVSALGLSAQTTATVSGNLRDAGVTNLTSRRTFVRFELRNFGAQIPKVTGTAVIANPVKDFFPDGSGNISGTVYRNSAITPISTFYRVCIIEDGSQFRCADYLITTSTFDLDTDTPIVTPPVPALPTTYTTIQEEGANLTGRFILNFIGSGITCVDNSGNLRTDCTVTGGGGVAGSDTQVQFNDGGAFGADPNFTWNKTSDILTVPNLDNIRFVDGVKFAATAAGIQDAHDNLPTRGGIIFLPEGDVPLSATVVVTKPVEFRGRGGGSNADVGSIPGTAGTVLTWTGAPGGTMFQFTATSGAGNQALKRAGLSGLMLDCANSAAIGAQFLSVHFPIVRDVTLTNCTTVALDTNVVATLGEARDVVRGDFSSIIIRQIEAASGIGIRLGGDATANTAFNSWSNIDIIHDDGVALQANVADNNYFSSLRIVRTPTGTGIGVLLDGVLTVHNYFFHLDPGTGGLVQQNSATNNFIYGYDRANAAPAPTITTGNLVYTNDGSNGVGWHPDRFFIDSDNGPLPFQDDSNLGLLLRDGGTGNEFKLRLDDTSRRAIFSVDPNGGGHTDAFEIGNDRVLSLTKLGVGDTAPDYALDVVSVSPSITALRFGNSSSDQGGFLVSADDNQAIIAGGSSHNGTNWIAKATSASHVNLDEGAMQVYGDTGLTPGGSFTPTLRLNLTTAGVLTTDVVNATTGFRVGGVATTGRFLRGNGTNFVASAGAASGTGSCTNQFVRALNDDAAPTCATVTASDTDETTFTGVTWGANADFTWTFDSLGATNPVLSFTGSNINVSTGGLQVGGSTVARAADNLSFFAPTTSSQLRTVLSDEGGTGVAMFGLFASMSDDLGCTGSQVVRRNAGDTAFECATLSGGGASWSELTAPTGAVAMVSDATGETALFDFQAAFTTGTQFHIQSSVGNPTGGTLFGVTAHDSDVTVARFTKSNDSAALVEVDSGSTAAQSAGFQLRDRGTPIWQIIKTNGNDFSLVDQTVSVNRLFLVDGGDSLYRSGLTTTDHVFGNSAATERFRILGDANTVALGPGEDTLLTRSAAGIVGVTSVVDAATGYRIGGAATTGNVLRGNGTNFISAQLALGDLATFSSADLRGRLTDEVGTGAAMFGLISTMADDLGCTGSQVVRRNAGDTAFECATLSGGGAAWNEITNPAGAQALTMGANTTTWTWDSASGTYRSTHSSAFSTGTQFRVDASGAFTGGILFQVDQHTGNPTAGTLVDLRAADTNVTVLRAGDGTNGITLSQAGALTAEGTGSITATAGDSATSFFTTGTLEDARLSANVALYNNGSKTWGAGSPFNWTFDAGATDPVLEFTSGNLKFSGATTYTFEGGATDPVLTPGNGVLNLSTGKLAVGDSAPDHSLDVVAASPSITAIRFGVSTAQEGGFLISSDANQAVLSGGAQHNGTDWIARATSASFINMDDGATQFYGNTGLTVGVSFTPTLRLNIGSTGALTNVSLDAEGTNNTLTLTWEISLDAASCNEGTAALNMNTPTGDAQTAPTEACNDTGSIQRPSADYSGSAVNGMEFDFPLPKGWTGNIDFDLWYVTTAASPTGNVEWDISTVCRASGESWDASFNAIQTITDAVGSQNNLNIASQAALTTTGCAADEIMSIRVSRDGVSDTNNDSAKLLKVRVLGRRAI